MSDKKPNKFKAVVADSGSKKFLMFAGAAVAVAVGVGMTMGGDEGEAMPSQMRSAPNVGGPTLNADAPAPYQEAVREAERQRIAEAERAGKSAIPALIGSSAEAQKPVDVDLKLEAPKIVRPEIAKPKDIKPVEIPEPEKKEIPVIKRPEIIKPEPKPVAPVVRVPQAAPVQAQAAPEPQLVERPAPVVNDKLYKAYSDQMSRLIDGMNPKFGAPSTSYYYHDRAQRDGGNGSDYPELDFGDQAPGSASSNVASAPTTDAQPAPASGKAEPPVKLPLPGKILYAQMITEANSDQPGPITARILQGDLAGSTLLGSFRVANNALILEFQGITVEETASGERVDAFIPVPSVAVNVEHVGSGVATDVDHHLFQRVAVTFATNFIAGIGEAISASGTTIVENPDGTTSTANQILTTEQQLLVASGSAAAEASGTLQSIFGDRDTTVKVAPGTPIGVLFLQR